MHRNELEEYGNDFCGDLTKEQIASELFSMGVSIDYNKPATLDQLKRMAKEKIRLCFNSIMWSNNLVDISRVHGKDLHIEREREHLLTYSFPCQDLSLAGKGAGMEKGSGTRSGLLWEVERILSECENKPQVLLMENVTQVHGAGNENHFKKWLLRLEEMGYQNYWEDMTAVDYGIPQTRNRTFMISIQGDYNYKFPKPVELKLRLKDLLENNVDEKYYLSKKMINGMLNTNFESYKLENKMLDRDGEASTIIARFEGTPQLIMDVPSLKIKNATKKGFLEATEGDGIDISSRMESHRGTVQKDKAQTLTTMGGENVGVIVSLKRGYDCEVKQEQSQTNQIDFIGNYSKSNYNQTSIVGKNGIAPTVTENHGQVTAITESVLIGGFGTKGSTNQYRTQNRVYSSSSSPTLSTAFNPYFDSNLRIRKLTPRECFRLMGLKDEDIDLVMENQSNASAYHLAGDSIVTTCLMAIIGQLFDIDWNNKFKPEEWWKKE